LFVVGLTGGIGSGKSAVSERFAARGIDIVDADVASRIVVEPGQPALASIAEHFGSDVITADGWLDRALMRQRVFAVPAERQWLERLLHPLISEHLGKELAGARSKYVILVSPLLFEAGQWRLTHRVLVVDVPEEVQIARTAARDRNSADQVKAIMAAQTSRATRLERADDVIVNDKGLDHLDREVARLHALYLQLADQRQKA
jgi:dephospho-CoA kinase